MRVFILLAVVFAVGCSPSSKKAEDVAGGMTAKEICSIMGYLIRNKLGDKVKTVGMPCEVVSVKGGSVEMFSAYKTPLRGSPIEYYAKGYALDGKFSFYKIKAVGIDEEYVSFPSW